MARMIDKDPRATISIWNTTKLANFLTMLRTYKPSFQTVDWWKTLEEDPGHETGKILHWASMELGFVYLPIAQALVLPSPDGGCYAFAYQAAERCYRSTRIKSMRWPEHCDHGIDPLLNKIGCILVQ